LATVLTASVDHTAALGSNPDCMYCSSTVRILLLQYMQSGSELHDCAYYCASGVAVPRGSANTASRIAYSLTLSESPTAKVRALAAGILCRQLVLKFLNFRKPDSILAG
jgi:hypothetical protein